MNSNCTISARNLLDILLETAFRNLPPPPGDDIVLRLHFCHPVRVAQSVTWHILYMYNIVIELVLCLIVSCQHCNFKGELVFIAQSKNISEQTVFQISVFQRKYASGCLPLRALLCSICLASPKALKADTQRLFFLVWLLFLMRHVAAKTHFNIEMLRHFPRFVLYSERIRAVAKVIWALSKKKIIIIKKKRLGESQDKGVLKQQRLGGAMTCRRSG